MKLVFEEIFMTDYMASDAKPKRKTAAKEDIM
jgi:hypothetical protein